MAYIHCFVQFYFNMKRYRRALFQRTFSSLSTVLASVFKIKMFFGKYSRLPFLFIIVTSFFWNALRHRYTLQQAWSKFLSITSRSRFYVTKFLFAFLLPNILKPIFPFDQERESVRLCFSRIHCSTFESTRSMPGK